MQTEQPDQDTLIDETAASAQDSDADSSLPTVTPGEILQAERLRRNLSEKDIADKLHITMHYVRAIEDNRYDKLPGAVFAKGYIKSYALLLELDVAEVTGLFDGINSKQQEKKEEANRKLMARRRSDRNKPWVYASVACFIIGFAALWAFNYYSADAAVDQVDANDNSGPSPVTIASRPIAQTPPTSPIASTPSTFVQEAGVRTRNAQAAVATEVAGAELAMPENSEVDNTPTLVAALSTLAAQQARAESAGVADQRIEPADSRLQTSAQTTAQTAAVINTAAQADSDNVISVDAEGEDVLRISFSGESWIEVNDANAKQIYRDIREAGDVLEITGDAPFSILLGDAPFTKMYLNGAEIDVTDDIRIDNSARLTVGL